MIDWPGRMADELVADGTIVSPAVEAAFRAVPRHVFIPEAGLDVAYARHDAVVTKRAADGTALSSVSAASMQARMLEQARIEPGMRVLEIGSGGYDAALLAHVVGPGGAITTMDIDADVVARTRRLLSAAGVAGVDVVQGDAEGGWQAGAPYDRVIVTVRAWDVPPAWLGQLVDGGVLVVPLELRGLTRSLALQRTGSVLVSESAVVCGFVPMQGLGAHTEHVIEIPGGGVRFADEPGPAELPLRPGPAQVWTGRVVGHHELAGSLPLWLATVVDEFCTVTAFDGPLRVPNPFGTPAAVRPGAFAHLAARPVHRHELELGAHGYGPAGAHLADELATHARRWHDDVRAGPDPAITVHPASARLHPPRRGRVLRKRHSQVVVSWDGPT